MLDPQQTVASLVLDHSECAPIFLRHRIDYCCKGELSIAEASRQKGIALEPLVDELARAIAERRGPEVGDPRALSTSALIVHIVSTHHAYLRKTLPFVRTLAMKVGRVHGDHNPKLRELEAVVGELYETFIPHLDSEEQTLFPILSAKETEAARVASELASMHEEHLEVGAQLERMRVAADDYQLPDWACNSYRTLFAELTRLEADVHTHVHLENHVLGPRFVHTVKTAEPAPDLPASCR